MTSSSQRRYRSSDWGVLAEHALRPYDTQTRSGWIRRCVPNAAVSPNTIKGRCYLRFRAKATAATVNGCCCLQGRQVSGMLRYLVYGKEPGQLLEQCLKGRGMHLRYSRPRRPRAQRSRKVGDGGFKKVEWSPLRLTLGPTQVVRLEKTSTRKDERMQYRSAPSSKTADSFHPLTYRSNRAVR